MINLVLADLYKESRKKSFYIFILLIIFVSILSLVIINKNIRIESEQVVSYPLYSKEEYENVNKNGSYQQYLKDYDNYDKLISKEIDRINNEDITKSHVLFSYYPTFLYILGILIIFIAFHSFSYDYQNKSIRYLFLSKRGRSCVFFSKIISIILILMFFMMILFITYFSLLVIMTKGEVLTQSVYVYFNNSLELIPLILYYLIKSFLYLIPIIFIIITTMFLTILFNGSTLALIISNIIYFCSLLFSQMLINYGYTFIQYTFLPYLDFTYFDSESVVLFNNLIYNIGLSFNKGLLVMSVSVLFFIVFSLLLLKRDV